MLGAVALLAAVAATSPHMGIAISPASVTAPGTVASSQQYQINNPGSIRESITVQVINMRPVANAPGKYAPYDEYDHYSVDTQRFMLAPHAHKTVTVTLKPDGYGHHLGIVALATANQKGFARIHAEVVSKYTVTGPAAPSAPTAQAVPTMHKSEPPVMLLSAVSLLLLIVAGLGRYLIKRRRTA